ncbi:MAG: MoxR family ATPase [Myxococcales bacterium]|nr:MoxR family ATPase [Myxococcales bacterium]
MNAEFELVRRGQREPIGRDALASRRIPRELHDLRASARSFEIDDELANAVNVALAVGAPLLLTGEPGTGKTQLAYYLVWYFGLEKDEHGTSARQPFTFHVKSTSEARDVLYRFDTVAYFHDAQRRDGRTLSKADYVTPGPLWRAVDTVNRGQPAVVLIDEIDKAPRDFPNDLLHELDQYAFTVRESGETITRDADAAPPIVIITSNSEKRLPEAFLRRCIFHNIHFDEDVLRRAVAARRRRGELGQLDERTITAARDSFMELRESTNLNKRPATAEFLAWLVALDMMGVQAHDLEGRSVGDLPLLSALIKDSGDLTRLGRGS